MARFMTLTKINGWSDADFDDSEWDGTREFVPDGLGLVTDRLPCQFWLRRPSSRGADSYTGRRMGSGHGTKYGGLAQDSNS